MDNRETILETALDLFYTRGYDAVGVQEIAERSGVTKPTLYYYFKSKYGLLEQLLKSRSEGFAAELKEACAYHGDLKNTLCAAARTAASFVAREPEFSALFVALYHSARGNDAYKAVRPLGAPPAAGHRADFHRRLGGSGQYARAAAAVFPRLHRPGSVLHRHEAGDQ